MNIRTYKHPLHTSISQQAYFIFLHKAYLSLILLDTHNHNLFMALLKSLFNVENMYIGFTS